MVDTTPCTAVYTLLPSGDTRAPTTGFPASNASARALLTLLAVEAKTVGGTNMRKTMIILALATLTGTAATGCIVEPEATDADKFREGIPSQNEVKLEEPVASENANTPQTFEPGMGLQDDTDGTAYATYYRFTREMFDGVNLGTAAILGSVWIIVNYPPTTLEDEEAIWGPWTEALSPAEYRFRATEVEEDEYDYALEARAKGSDDPWTAIWLGQGFGNAHPEHHAGWFELDFDAANDVDPTRLNADEESGKVRVEYDLRSYPTSIRAYMTEPSSDAWFDIRLTTNEDGGGRVDIDAFDDIEDEKNTAKEDIAMRSRWVATGAGRADVTIAGGDLPEGTIVNASECWSSNFERVYWTDTIGIETEEGSVNACAFDDAE